MFNSFGMLNDEQERGTSACSFEDKIVMSSVLSDLYITDTNKRLLNSKGASRRLAGFDSGTQKGFSQCSLSFFDPFSSWYSSLLFGRCFATIELSSLRRS